MDKRDYYEVLGVQKNASDSEIKKQYRKLSKQFHPDTQIGKTEGEKQIAENKFKEINEAYEVLSDKDKRQKYNQFGHSLGNNKGFYDQTDDLDEFVKNFQRRGFGAFDQQAPQGPPPLKVSINLTLKEMFNGATKKFKYKVNRVCSHCKGEKYLTSEGGKKNICAQCHGTGSIQSRRGPMLFTQTCPACGGVGHSIVNGCKTCNSTGFEKIDETIEVITPKGVPNGSYMAFNQKGNEYIINNTSMIGDLIVFFNQIPDETFIRNGDDLHQILNVSIYDCILGNEVVFKTIDDKKHKFKLRIGTESDGQFRLGGLGMPVLNTNNYGDLYVHIKHIMPTKLNDEEIQLLTKLKENIDDKQI